MFWNIGVTKRNENRLLVLIMVMFSAILLPSFKIHPSLPNIRIDEMILFGLFGVNFLFFVLNGFRFSPDAKVELQRQQPMLKWVYILFGLLFLSYVVSNFYGVVILNFGYFGFRDIMELVTYFKFFLVITLVLAIDFQEVEYKILKTALLWSVIFLIVLGWGQYLNLFNLNTWLSPFFNPIHWETMIIGNPARVLGTFDNPNFLGIFTVMVLSYLTVEYFFGDHKGKFPWPLFILIGFVIKLEYLTISRTALFGIALLFVIVCAWAFFYFQRSREVMIKIGALFILTMVLFATASDGFFYRLNEGLDFSTSTSFQGHVQQWDEAVESITDSLILGWGTQKHTMTTIVDNEYALHARRYGVVGLAIYLSFFLLPFVQGIKTLRQRSKHLAHPTTLQMPEKFMAAYVAVLPSIFVYIFMAGIFYNLQLMTIFSISIGLVYNALKNEQGLL